MTRSNVDHHSMVKFFQLLALMLVSVGCVARIGRCEAPQEVLPDDPRVAELQSPDDFFGFAIGSRHLRHDQILAYFEYLAANSDRARWIPYAKSHGMRPLGVLAVSSPEHVSRLDRIRNQRPKLTAADAPLPSDDGLLVMCMGYNVHGDEASAANAAPLVAYHLVSSTSDQVLSWLNKGVYLIDPCLNPDGLDRFANWANEARGRFPSPQAIDREHNQPWPGGRTNYYWFDLNRDWLPLTHPESQGRLRLFHQWKPNVVLDFHEMGGTSTYFFQPGISARTNPFTPPRNLELTKKFAEEHARTMDEANELFFTEERFDDFYIGKGSTYPDIHGAVGILFEQGSTRGLRLKNELTDRHFRDTVANQVRTSLSSLRSAAGLSSELLAFQHDFYRNALESGQADELTAYVLTGSTSRITAARDLLQRHAVECYLPASEVRLEGNRFPCGQALVIPTAQPEVTMVRSLMEPLQSFEENLFYDVSTWHLPSAMDVDWHGYRNDLPAAWLTDGQLPSEPFQFDPAVAGYAFRPGELAAPRLVASLMRIGADVRITTQSMRAGHEETVWPEGTFLVLRQPNRQKWERIGEILGEAWERDGLAIEAIASSLTAEGPDLGSTTIKRLPQCKPLLVVGPGTSSGVAGAIWHYLDVRMGQAATVVDTTDFSAATLRDYSCVILPDGRYSSWSDGQAAQLKDYVREGGTLIGVAGAINWLQSKEVISAVAPVPGKAEDDAEKVQSSAAAVTADTDQPHVPFGGARDAAALEAIAGAFFMTQIDPTHPLGYGFPDTQVPVFKDSSARFAIPANPYQTAAHYTDVIAGYVSQRNRQRLLPSAAAWVVEVGKGRVILLADNPVFRGYVRSSERFLTNAMLIGPTIAVPARQVRAAP